MSLRETSEKKMLAQLNELKTEIDELRKKAGKMETSLQLEYYTLIDELELNLQIARQHYELLKRSSDEKWHEIRKEFEVIWCSMRELIKSVNSP